MKMLFFLSWKYKNAPEARGAGVRAERKETDKLELS